MKFRAISLASVFIVLLVGCQEKAPPEKEAEARLVAVAPPAAEIDVLKVEEEAKTAFKLLKTETVGFMPRHRFFWVCLPERASKDKLERLASALIAETIRTNPAFFHSFTVHFFCQTELARTVEASKPFARATYLPEGTWVKVGRVPIDGYKDYVLACTLLE